MYCKHCGFELNENVNYCPACGKSQLDPVEREATAAPAPEPVAPAVSRVNTFCILGFTLSCAAFLPVIFGLTALPGLVCSILGLLQLRTRDERGKGLAIAGVVIAVISIILFILAFLTLQQLIASGELEQYLPAGQFKLPT